MNCFQNCTFTYDSQHDFTKESLLFCCELLSKLYFYLWFPTSTRVWKNKIRLWIAFKIVLLLMIPNKAQRQTSTWCVVNCFQNCTFTYDSQPWFPNLHQFYCCELLSKLYFYLWFPTLLTKIISVFVLWIAFKIVLLLMIPNW